MEKIHIGISWKNQYIFIQKIAKIGTTELAKFSHSLSETELTRHSHRPNAIQDMTLHKIGQFLKVFKMYNEALP